MNLADPILTAEEAQNFEETLFKGSAEKSYAAMSLAGKKVANSLLDEFGKFLGIAPEILCISGGGHNGGDALIAAEHICKRLPHCKIVLAVAASEKMKPNTRLAFESLQRNFKGTDLTIINISELARLENRKFDLLIEGISGMSFIPPARCNMLDAIDSANRIYARLKTSIDISAGAHQTPQNTVFRADATYATGIAKSALFTEFNRPFVGRIRYLDLGFFDDDKLQPKSKDFIAREDCLDFLRRLRPSISDKRTYGHLFVIGGSRTYPGAVLMNVRAALRGGCGLVSAFVPETLAPAFAAAEPSAIWIACPEDESGALALEAFGQIRARLRSASAIVAGSGMTNSRESSALIREILKVSSLPTVLDADAISAENIEAATARKMLLLTPHEGEFLRIAKDASDASLLETAKLNSCAIALKSSATRVCEDGKIIRCTGGSPMLARAGSGDILAGLAGALMCNSNIESAMGAGVCASVWLGLCAREAFAETANETSVATSDIAKYISAAISRKNS